MRALLLSLTLAAAALAGTVLTPSSADARPPRYYSSYYSTPYYYSYPYYSGYSYPAYNYDAGATVTSPSVSLYTPSTSYYSTPGYDSNSYGSDGTYYRPWVYYGWRRWR